MLATCEQCLHHHVPYALEVRYGTVGTAEGESRTYGIDRFAAALQCLYLLSGRQQRKRLPKLVLTRPGPAEAELKMPVTSHPPWHHGTQLYNSKTRQNYRPIVFRKTYKQQKQGCATASASDTKTKLKAANRKRRAAFPSSSLQGRLHAECRPASSPRLRGVT
jgi:hypothetical protein